MQHAPAQDNPQILQVEMSLREQLLAAGASGPSPYPRAPSTQAQAPALEHVYPASDSPSPNDNAENLAHQQQTPYAHMSGDSAGDDGLSPQGGKGKRELSTSKRAAQNRAAQRAFRQRKEGYIKKLEEQVKEFQNMEQNYRTLQSENYQLREYILNLQSRLLESSSDIPPAPAHVDLPSSSSSTGRAPPPDPRPSEPYKAHSQQPAGRPSQRGTRPDSGGQSSAAAANPDAGARPQHSLYGLGAGADYPNKRSRTDGSDGSGSDMKGVI
ncbi:hypothetical protein LTR53_001888 [Teratosphaeriaceae sp. CCFEE 6253]|nr:hypothetical protein LTR53_001888 [Teratosphaeriaceae sp. CCFEE 6253]